jgi:hypothetical protein
VPNQPAPHIFLLWGRRRGTEQQLRMRLEKTRENLDGDKHWEGRVSCEGMDPAERRIYPRSREQRYPRREEYISSSHLIPSKKKRRKKKGISASHRSRSENKWPAMFHGAETYGEPTDRCQGNDIDTLGFI